jgi:hypothetical protein
MSCVFWNDAQSKGGSVKKASSALINFTFS